jgi:3-dehydroquinate dehydratase II
MKILVLNGPNLNLLGVREPDVYGIETLEDLESKLKVAAKELGCEVDFRQTNSEDELIAWLHEALEAKSPVVLNPAAFTHYSYALRDACAALTSSGVELIEVHISNPHAREQFRQNSVIAAVATGQIAGFGFDSYALALRQLAKG